MKPLMIKSAKETYDNLIQIRQEKIHMEYAIFLNQSPLYGIYYHNNVVKSYREKTLDSTVGYLGIDSPLQYDKIEDFPFYMLQDLDNVSEDNTDFGIDTVQNGRAVIIPNTIEPYESDYIVLTYNNINYVYIVKKVLPDNITDKKFYQIEFTLLHNDIQEIEALVTDNYITDTQYLGTAYKPIVLKSDSELLGFLHDSSINIIDYLFNGFYNKYTNNIMANFSSTDIYDPIMTSFITRTKILHPIKYQDIFHAIYVDEIDIGGKDINYHLCNKFYKNTLFYAIENKNFSKLTHINYGVIQAPTYDNALNYIYGFKYFIADYEYINKIEIFDNNFISNIQNNILYSDNIHLFENVVIKFLNNVLTKENIADEMSVIEFETDTSIKEVTKAIITLYILRYFYNKILS